jgi:hypothetical protein
MRTVLPLFLVLAAALPARAQTTTTDTTATGETSASTESASTTTETTTTTPPAADAVPPVMVAVLSTGHVPDDVVAAVQNALVNGVTPMAGGRPVLALGLPAMRDELAACADEACRGALLGRVGVIGAVIARLSRRTTRGPVELSLEMIDPMSGTARLPAQTGSVADAASAPTTLAPMIETLRPAMFSPPPPPPTLLVTVNVDGATVMIDEQSIGESPVAVQRLTRGHHVVMVTRAGYSGTRREVDLEPGQTARLDITLAPSVGAERQDDGTFAAAPPPRPVTEEWWFWTIIGVGGAALVGAAIGIGVAATPSQPAPDPNGVPLPPIHF